MITEINEKTFDAEVKNADTVFVDFYASWCMPCKMLAPAIEALSEKRTDVKFCKVDVDENMELARRFSISSIPAVFVFKNGVVSASLVGLADEDALNELIDR